MTNTQYINLNLVPSGVLPVVHCSQYDIGRPIGIVVYDGNSVFDLDSYTVTIEATRTDGTPITAAVMTDDNIGVFAVTATMTNHAGVYPAQLVITDGQQNRVGSLPFTMCVIKAAMDENAEAITEDKSLYQQYSDSMASLIAGIRSDIANEVAARTEADIAIQTDFRNADTALLNSINSETAARIAQDNVLQGEINQYVTPSSVQPDEIVNARVGANGITYSTLGDAVRGNDTQLNQAITAFTGDSVIVMTPGYYINITGTTADVNTPTAQGSTPFRYAVVPCVEGEEFIINSKGGSSPRAYGFVAADGTVLFKADANVTITNLKVFAPSNSAYLVINDSLFSGISYKAATVNSRNEKVTKELYNFSNSIEDVHSVEFVSGSITTGGTVSSTNTRIRCAALTPITRGMHWEIREPYEGKCAIYGNGAYFEASNFIEYVDGNPVLWSNDIFIPDSYVGNQCAVVIRKKDHETEDISSDLSGIADYVMLHEPKNIVTNDKLMDDSCKELDAFYFDWDYGHFITSGGNIGSLLSQAVTYPISVKAGNVFKNLSADYDDDGKTLSLTVASFTGSTFVERVILASGGTYTIPSSVDNIRVSYGYPSSVQNRPDMSPTILDTYFNVIIMGEFQPFGIFTDGERPVYAAFGASTTVAAVHHYTGEDTTYSRYNYPDYIGRVLNLKTYNLGVGSTGFMERTSLVDNNIMDQIYNNDDILAKARLVTIVFGYGNDHYVGPSGSQVLFPIGEYDDYYPYDEEGYHPTGQAGTVEMVNKGATLMGCLNWCIKWINEKYPYAQLVVVFGSPSTNQDRTVTFTAQTGSAGVAPYKMTFTDPYSTDPDHTSINYGIYQIGVEIKKLRAALDIPIIDMFYEGNAFSWYSTYAKKPDNQNEYALFSTTGTVSAPEWNSHPNDAGYLYYARYVAGKIISLFKH